jgi:trehalose 6-phosphate synthase/phosphatase
MKIVIVSNRLPVSVREEEGELRFGESPGGLASGLRTYLTSDKAPTSGNVWVGWPGKVLPEEVHEEVRRRCREEFAAVPVFLSQEETESFYEGFCNNTLWPLFHYFPQQVVYDEDFWVSYERVNGIYRDAVLEVARPGDLVWVHDYHLMLLPAMLKGREPKLRVGFFLHIPFPSYEMFRLLPDHWRTALLDGLLGAELVGFHTHDYTQNFLKCVRRLRGHEHEMGQIVLTDRVVKAGTFPMGIQFDFFNGQAQSPEATRARDELRQSVHEARLILSIDRLDYTKGIANRLLAYQAFLEQYPQWHGQTVLLMVVVPSRMNVPDYQQMKLRIDQLVGQINGRFGTLTWTPIVYQFRSFPQEQLIPLYGASDVMLVTPLRDGMNLVAKEYVASRCEETGVLILSEMAGAASELGEAITVNPNDIPGVARSIHEALLTPLPRQRRAMRQMRTRIRRYDVGRWAQDLLETLQEDKTRLDQRVLSPSRLSWLLQEFRTADSRLILLNDRVTLLPPHADGWALAPDVVETLEKLARVSEVVIVSDQPRAVLETRFGALDVHLVAEHGAWVRKCREDGKGEWIEHGGLSVEWKPGIRELMELYVDRLPGSWIEERDYTLAWHYERTHPDLAALRARELIDHLVSLTESSNLRVAEGNKVIEVRPTAVSRAGACQPFLEKGHDFVLAIGADPSDEEIFRQLPQNAYSIRAGITNTYARFNVYTQAQARALLRTLADAERTESVPQESA